MNDKNVTVQEVNISSAISNILQGKNNTSTNDNVKSNLSENNQKTTYNEQIIAKDPNSYNNFIANRRRATNERDTLFNEFLKAYTYDFKNKSTQKITLKKCFFILIMIIFFIILLIPVFEIIFFSSHNNIASFIVSIIGSFIELFTAFLVLPKIIAEYLFNKEEDNNMVTIIEKMQIYNLKKIKEEEHNEN